MQIDIYNLLDSSMGKPACPSLHSVSCNALGTNSFVTVVYEVILHQTLSQLLRTVVGVQGGVFTYMTYAYLELYSCKLTDAHNKIDHVAFACSKKTF